MDICLGTRTAETVAIYYEKSKCPAIRAMLPQEDKSLEETLEAYQKTLLPGANSYGKTILADGKYIGDIWCYCIDMNEEPTAMLSYCILDEAYWSKGVATAALALFLKEMREKFPLQTVGAFTFSDNLGSIKVLEKNGFVEREEFWEAGRASKYFQLSI